MSKKKLFATALLSVSLLGVASNVVSAYEHGSSEAKIDLPATTVKDADFKYDASYETLLRADLPSAVEVSHEIKTVFDLYSSVQAVIDPANGQPKYVEISGFLTYSTDKYDANGVLIENIAKGKIEDYTKTNTLGLVVTIAGRTSGIVQTDGTGRFKVRIPADQVVGDHDEVSVMFSTTGLGTEPSKINVRVTSKAQQITYAKGVVTVTNPRDGQVVRIERPDGKVSYVNVSPRDGILTNFKTDTLPAGTRIELYQDEVYRWTANKGLIQGQPLDKDEKTSLIIDTFVVAEKSPLYRAYNPNNGEHLYTTDENEYSVLTGLGWTAEGVAWEAVNAGDPVYRVYNPNTGDHHYTLDVKERDQLVKWGWHDEGTAFFSDTAKGKTVHRLYNPNAKQAGTHVYTIDSNEATVLKGLGWNYEGFAWYGAK